MDAADTTATPVPVPLARRRSPVARVCVMFLPLACVVAASGLGAYARQPVRPAAATAPAPTTDGLRNVKNPDWSTDPSDPFPMPANWADVELMKQSPADAYAK